MNMPWIVCKIWRVSQILQTFRLKLGIYVFCNMNYNAFRWHCLIWRLSYLWYTLWWFAYTCFPAYLNPFHSKPSPLSIFQVAWNFTMLSQVLRFRFFSNFLAAWYSKLHCYKRSLGQSPCIGELIVYSRMTSWKWHARIWFCLYGKEWPYSQE